MHEASYRALFWGAETSQAGLRWVTALSATLPWVGPLMKDHYGGVISPAAVAALVVYTHPDRLDREGIHRILALPDLTTHLLLGLRAAGHDLDTATHADPAHDPGAIGDPVERAWYWARASPGQPAPVCGFADLILSRSHAAQAAESASDPVVWPPAPPLAVNVEPPRLGPPHHAAVNVRDASHGPVSGWEPVVEVEGDPPAATCHTLITRRARSWLWLVRAAAARLVDGGTVTGPGARGTVRVVARSAPLSRPPIALTRPRWAYLTVTPHADGTRPYVPLLWGAALGRWPLQHALAAIAARERDMAEYQHTEPWSSLEPEVHLHIPEVGTIRAHVQVHDRLPRD